MRTFEWLFDENGKVKEGLECLLKIEPSYWYDDEVYKIVKLTGYRPYWTDETNDPSNDEVCECNYIEVDGDVDDSQVRLSDLFPIEWHEPSDVLMYGEVWSEIGIADNVRIIESREARLAVNEDDIEQVRHITDLSDEELKSLYKQVSLGSIYISDYSNNLNVPMREVLGICDGYLAYLYDAYGDEYESKDTVEEFVYYCQI